MTSPPPENDESLVRDALSELRIVVSSNIFATLSLYADQGEYELFFEEACCASAQLLKSGCPVLRAALHALAERLYGPHADVRMADLLER